MTARGFGGFFNSRAGRRQAARHYCYCSILSNGSDEHALKRRRVDPASKSPATGEDQHRTCASSMTARPRSRSNVAAALGFPAVSRGHWGRVFCCVARWRLGEAADESHSIAPPLPRTGQPRIGLGPRRSMQLRRQKFGRKIKARRLGRRANVARSSAGRRRFLLSSNSRHSAV